MPREYYNLTNLCDFLGTNLLAFPFLVIGGILLRSVVWYFLI